MPLTEHEQRVIEELERSLLRDDPALAKAFRTTPKRSGNQVLLVVFGMLVGLGVLAGGVFLQNMIIAAGGFVVMFASLAFAIVKRPVKRTADELAMFPQTAPKEFETSNFLEPDSGFMGRMENRWNRRQGEPQQ